MNFASPSQILSPRNLFRAAMLSVALLGTAGCSTSPTEAVIVPDVPADKLYNQGLAYIEKRDFKEAIKKFNEVDRTAPYSDWGRKSLIMIAFANYESGEWEASITASRRFLALYPAHPDAAYAQFLLGSAYYSQIPDVSRDQTRTERAIAALDEVHRRWPTSQYAEEARKKADFGRDMLAGREMMIGRFYLEQRNYTGAINRFKVVVTAYQTTRHVEEALMRLTEAYMALGIVHEAQTAAAILGHNYPDSRWYKDAYTLVKSGGTEPREDSNSWISKAFRKVGLG